VGSACPESADRLSVPEGRSQTAEAMKRTTSRDRSRRLAKKEKTAQLRRLQPALTIGFPLVQVLRGGGIQKLQPTSPNRVGYLSLCSRGIEEKSPGEPAIPGGTLATSLMTFSIRHLEETGEYEGAIPPRPLSQRNPRAGNVRFLQDTSSLFSGILRVTFSLNEQLLRSGSAPAQPSALLWQRLRYQGMTDAEFFTQITEIGTHDCVDHTEQPFQSSAGRLALMPPNRLTL